jgi:hypothetical protein
MRNKNTYLFSFIFLSCTVLGQNTPLVVKELLNSNENTLADTLIQADSISILKSSAMLDENTYWEIITTSLKETDNQEDQELFLIAEIEKRSPEEMIGFRLRTDKLLFDTYTSELWCAAYIMNGGISDGGFEYFRCWLISKGRDAFYAAKAKPDSLMNLVIKDQESYEFEGFWYVAITAFKNKTGKELYPYIDYDTFTTNDDNYPLLNFTWDADEPQTMEVICPVLFQTLWN